MSNDTSGGPGPGPPVDDRMGTPLISTVDQHRSEVGDRLYKTDHISNGRLRLVELDPDKVPRD